MHAVPRKGVKRPMTGSVRLDSKHINQHDMQRGPIEANKVSYDIELKNHDFDTQVKRHEDAGLASKLSHGIRVICESPLFISELVPIVIWM
mgnify:CR=1 FL=1